MHTLNVSMLCIQCKNPSNWYLAEQCSKIIGEVTLDLCLTEVHGLTKQQTGTTRMLIGKLTYLKLASQNIFDWFPQHQVTSSALLDIKWPVAK